jgi:hypothetical protein
LGVNKGGGAASKELADDGGDCLEGLRVAAVVGNNLWPAVWVGELLVLKNLLGGAV